MKQITLVVDDKVGVIADISYILGKSKINIDSLTVDMHGNKSVINLVVKDDKKAKQMLESNGYKVLESEVLVFKVKDEPGALSEVSRKLKDSHINIESLYLLSRGDGYSLDAVKVDKPKKARRILEPYLFKPDQE